MKHTSLAAFKEIVGKKAPELHFLTLQALMGAQRPLNQHEIHDRVIHLRPSAYSSIRSRIWELERAGLVFDTGQTNTKGTMGKFQCVTYSITASGRALMEMPLEELAATLKKTMRRLNELRDERRIAAKPIMDEYQLRIEKETRAIISKALDEEGDV